MTHEMPWTPKRARYSSTSHERGARLRRLCRLYESASADIRETGRNWYDEAQSFCSRLSAELECRFDVAAAVLAVLSPNCSWEQNQADARAVLYCSKHGIPWYQCKVATYNKNKLKAFTIADSGRVGNVVRGPKVTRFYLNIVGDHSEPAIDSHAINAYVGKRLVGSMAPSPPVALVEETFDAYMRAAGRVSETPSAFQAIIWLKWKQLIAAGHVAGYKVRAN